MFDFMINFLHIILAYSNKACHKINYKDLKKRRNQIFKEIPVMARQYSKTSPLLEIIPFLIITKIEAELLKSKFCRIL